MGYQTGTYVGFLDVNYDEGILSLKATLKEIACSAQISTESILSGNTNLIAEKFHPYMSPDLLLQDATSRRINLSALPKLVSRITETI